MDNKKAQSYFSPYSTSKITLTMSGILGVEFSISSATSTSLTSKSSITSAFRKHLEDSLYVRKVDSPKNKLPYELVSSELTVQGSEAFLSSSNSLTDLQAIIKYNIVLELPCYNPLFDNRDYSFDYYSSVINIGYFNFINLYSSELGGYVVRNIRVSRVHILSSPMTYTFQFPMPVKFTEIGFSSYLDYGLLEQYDPVDINSMVLSTTFMGVDLGNRALNSGSMGGCYYLKFDYEVETDTIQILSNKASGYPYFDTSNYPEMNNQYAEFCFMLTTFNLWLPAQGNQAISISHPKENAFIDFFNRFTNTQDCKIYDIPCHLGNVVAWLFNTPIFKGVINISKPLIDILITLIDIILEFKGLGIIAMVVMCMLVFGVLFKWVSNSGGD
ncbi:MAG: hypothetical protein OSJ74_08615 [Clostridia bacterium]|nr:hypothetical protein [Clostridia bacterium]